MTSNERNTAPEKHIRRGHPFLVLLLVLVAVGEAVYIFRAPLIARFKPAATSPAPAERRVLYWQDPMHPQYTSDKPGKAPDCGMDLVPVYADQQAKPAPQAERKVLYWTDAMNPGSKYDKPGKAPDGMDLVPVYEESPVPQQEAPKGALRITPEKQQLIGVQYGVVEARAVSKTIRAVAQLTYDETRITKVHSRIAGWIERVYVDFTGQLVKAGQPLLTVYSPDLVATQDEYLLALRARDNLGDSHFRDVADGANSLLEAARKRLELWDISDQQIAEVEKTRKPVTALTLYSPVSGFVTARNSYGKQRITPETELYAIADLSTVWAIADFYEYEARDVQLGQEVALAVSAFPGRSFRGKVTYIYPQLDNSTRTLRARVELPNRDFILKPDMYATAELKIDYGRRLCIPQEAVLDSGTEQVVFVALEGGYFESRKVQLGDRIDNQVIVLGGLKAGEKIVTSGNFLIDSESTLKSALGGMGMPGMDHSKPSGGTSEQKPSESAPPQPPAMDHSQHGKAEKPSMKEEPMDHSKHQKMPEQNNHD